MGYLEKKNFRPAFIRNALEFAVAAAQLEGVRRIALLGSITTPKPKPKDVDLLVTISEEVSITKLATLGRKLSGRQMSVGDASGADIFLCDEAGEYLGRTCHYRECHPRVRCEGAQCYGTYINNDFHLIRLKNELIQSPPVELYPTIVIRQQLPEDLRTALAAYEEANFRDGMFVTGN